MLALMEMRMVLSIIVSRFDLKLDPSYNPQKWLEDTGGFFITTKGPLPNLLLPWPTSFSKG
jgi:cytochrome P450